MRRGRCQFKAQLISVLRHIDQTSTAATISTSLTPSPLYPLGSASKTPKLAFTLKSVTIGEDNFPIVFVDIPLGAFSARCRAYKRIDVLALESRRDVKEHLRTCVVEDGAYIE